MDSADVSVALAPAAVTAVLKSLLENGLVTYGMSGHLGADIVVSALPFDRIETGENERARINLFVYQVNPRGITPARRAGAGDRGIRYISEIEMLYVVTAYGTQDLHTEMLLGCAVQSLADASSIDQERMRKMLAAQASQRGGRVVPPAQTAVAASGVGDRISCLRIVPYVMEPENLLNLWSSQQTAYRPSMTYQATLTLADEGAKK